LIINVLKVFIDIFIVTMEIEALEKLIIKSHAQDVVILELQQMQAALSETIRSQRDVITACNDRLQALEKQMQTMESRLNATQSRQNLIEMDSAADHELYGDRSRVVDDWRNEHNIGFNTDDIPFSERELLEKAATETRRRRGH
jgi:hypothetical protein